MNKKLIYSTILVLILPIFSALSHANDGAEKKWVFIPSQKLTEALIDFSYEYNRVVVGIPQVLRKYRSREIKGEFTAYQALQLLLSDTDLIIKSNEKNGYIVTTPIETSNNKDTIISFEEFLEEIYVTGRNSNFQKKIPTVSVDSFTRNNNDLANVFEPKNLTLLSPNLFISNFEEAATNITLRGMRNFGNPDQSTAPIAYHYNNHHIQTISISNIALFDINAVHIAKGPQLTNKGRNAIAGGIYIEPQQAELNVNSANVTIGTGNFGRQLIRSEINRSFSPDFSVRLATQSRKLDGYTRIVNNYDEIYGGPETDSPPLNYPGIRFPSTGSQTDFDSRFEFNDSDSWRLSGNWQASEKLSFKASAENHSISRGASPSLDPSFANRGNRFSAIFIQPEFNTDVDIYSFNSEYKNEHYSVDYQYSFLNSDRSSVTSQSFQRSFSVVVTGTPDESLQSFSHNLSFTNTDKDRHDLTVGLLYDRSKRSAISYIDVFGYDAQAEPFFGISLPFESPDFNDENTDTYLRYTKKYSKIDYGIGARYSVYTTRAKNFFVAECDVNFLPRLFEESLEGQAPDNIFFSDNLLRGEQVNGNRDGISDNQRCHAVSTLNDSQTDDFINLEASVLFKPHTNHNLSVRYANASRPGLILAGGNIRRERTNSIEARFFGNIENKNFSYALSVFNTQHKDMHAEGNRYADRDGDGEEDDFLFVDTLNIAESRTSGAELILTHEDQLGGALNASLAYLDAEIDEYDAVDNVFFLDNPWNPPSNDPRLASLFHSDFSGNSLPFSP